MDMNGSTNGHANVGVEASLSHPSQNGNTTLLPRIQQALELVHSTYSSNQSRQEASAYLERVKTDNEAPYHGFALASDHSQQPIVRHYALSILEYAIRHKWPEYSQEQAMILRGWVMQLSKNIISEDPQYLRNKTAQLWVEIAKRSWADDWLDMDELLVQLWELQGPIVYKEFVLFVLETLSDEVFNSEDTVAALRVGVLSKACVEIFTPAIVLAEVFPRRSSATVVRYGEQGWLVRLGELLDQCLGPDGAQNAQYQSCAVKLLAVYKSVMPWAVPRAIASASCVQRMCTSLAASTVSVQLASVECLHAIYCRLNFTDEEFLSLLCPIYTSQMVDLLRKLFEWSVVNPHDIDDEKYLFAKKFSEMMSNLGGYIAQNISAIPEDCDLPNLLNLFLSIVQSPSFLISIPVLVTWTHLLRSEAIGGSPIINSLIAPLLELCSSRLIRYESISEESDDPSLIFLLEDIDTIPERHAFLGNYRRYSMLIIELIVVQKQSGAMYHILSQVDTALEHLYDGQPPFNAATYSKTSLIVLRVDCQFSVVEAALKGYMKWRAGHGSKPQVDEQQTLTMESSIEAWCGKLLDIDFDDPIIRKRILQLAVAFSTQALDKNTDFMLKVLQHLLMIRYVEVPEHPAYSEAVKELLAEGVYELQRLASKMPDQLIDVYPQLEEKVHDIISSGTVDAKRQVSYQMFIFTIIHRTTKIEPDARLQKLREFIVPVTQIWQNRELDGALSSFGGFFELLGLSKVRDYLVSRNVNSIADWGSYALDDEGQAMQKELDERVKALPLRITKSFLGCSTDKIDKNTIPYQVSCELWRDSLLVILPNLLKFLGHAHAFHNAENWIGLPTEMRPIVSRILTDRFWQAGISEGSKDDFYARVSGTKSTLEGFASSIRGAVRTVREACYGILWCMSKLDGDFYGFSELPEPLAHALFADTHCLSSHQLISLLGVVRMIIEDCPLSLRDHFVPPILATCFTQMDNKCSSEWTRLTQKQVTVNNEGDNLTNEMKEESILRQLTHAAVMMVGGLLDPAKENSGEKSQSSKEASTYVTTTESAYPTMRKFCLGSVVVLEPLLLFCTHAIRMRDGRCAGVVLRIFRSIVPEFDKSDDTAFIREFISTEVLQACILSLHEPYFVDLQKDLAQLIATILICYSRITDTPKQVLCSIERVNSNAVDKCVDYLLRQSVPPRQQRALVLDLLRDLKGVSVSEQFRISKPVAVTKEYSKMQQRFMKTGQAAKLERQLSPNLDGVSGIFDEGQ
ncbi:armadillo-type protein [Calycina marina]|uniref:Armadillo-type protein n=1 Tax=Calycina marina TaxID=1763456 RepID=A0A9P7Z0E0_9HELO|nr:armadillo-type protein [Calycina marina]